MTVVVRCGEQAVSSKSSLVQSLLCSAIGVQAPRRETETGRVLLLQSEVVWASGKVCKLACVGVR